MHPPRFPITGYRPWVTLALATLTLVAASLVAPIGWPVRRAAAASAEADWSVEETQFVYLLNQARWRPEAVTAAAGLPPGTFLPRPPLAANGSLAASAQARSHEMAAHHYFSHQSPITGLWPNAVARAGGYLLPGAWPDATNNIESLHMGSPDPVRVLLSFIESPAHRDHLMGQGWFGTHREIGVGLAPGERIWSIHTAVADESPLFLTGVAYRDLNGNGQMDAGEGLAGVTVTAGGRAVTTNAGGGWAIPTAAGVYQVTADGGGLGSAAVTGEVGEFNVGVDFIAGGTTAAGPRAQVRAYSLCLGRPPTILGTSEADVIHGTDGPDVIHGLGGDDIIYGLGGDDTICGGPGDDQLDGGPGDDRLNGGGGRDLLIAGEGGDVLRVRLHQDTIIFGAGSNRIVLL